MKTCADWYNIAVGNRLRTHLYHGQDGAVIVMQMSTVVAVIGYEI